MSDAIDDLKQAVMQAPSDARLRLRWAAALHAAAQPEAALGEFEKAARLAPHDLDAAVGLATCRLQLGLMASAWSGIERHAEALRTSAAGACNLGLIALGCGHASLARQAFERALDLQPDEVRSLVNLSLLDAQDGRTAQAVQHAEQVTRLVPEDPNAWIHRIDLLLSLDQVTPALDLLDALRPDWRDHPAFVARRVRAGSILGRLTEAQALADPIRDSLMPWLIAWLPPADAWAPRPSDLPQVLAHLMLAHHEHASEPTRAPRDGLEPWTATLDALVRDATWRSALLSWPRIRRLARALPLSSASRALLSHALDDQHLRIAREVAPPVVPGRYRAADERPRIGVLLPALSAPAWTGWTRQLARHAGDAVRWLVYSLRVPGSFDTRMQPGENDARLVDLSCFTTREAIGRVRLDRLDVLIDASDVLDTPLAPMLNARVASRQLRGWIEAPASRAHDRALPLEYEPTQELSNESLQALLDTVLALAREARREAPAGNSAPGV
jgi:tetratricopeptide (TPR) repeat protein